MRAAILHACLFYPPRLPRVQAGHPSDPSTRLRFVDRRSALPAHALEECHTEHSKCLRVSYVLYCYRIPSIRWLKLGYESYFTTGAWVSYRHDELPYKARHFEGAPEGYVRRPASNNYAMRIHEWAVRGGAGLLLCVFHVSARAVLLLGTHCPRGAHPHLVSKRPLMVHVFLKR